MARNSATPANSQNLAKSSTRSNPQQVRIEEEALKDGTACGNQQREIHKAAPKAINEDILRALFLKPLK